MSQPSFEIKKTSGILKKRGFKMNGPLENRKKLVSWDLKPSFSTDLKVSVQKREINAINSVKRKLTFDETSQEKRLRGDSTILSHMKAGWRPTFTIDFYPTKIVFEEGSNGNCCIITDGSYTNWLHKSYDAERKIKIEGFKRVENFKPLLTAMMKKNFIRVLLQNKKDQNAMSAFKLLEVNPA